MGRGEKRRGWKHEENMAAWRPPDVVTDTNWRSLQEEGTAP